MGTNERRRGVEGQLDAIRTVLTSRMLAVSRGPSDSMLSDLIIYYKCFYFEKIILEGER